MRIILLLQLLAKVCNDVGQIAQSEKRRNGSPKVHGLNSDMAANSSPSIYNYCSRYTNNCLSRLCKNL